MSVRHHVYVGPYLAVKNRKEDTSATVPACANAACKRHGLAQPSDVGYCQGCGSPVGKVSVTERLWLCLDDVLPVDRLLEVDVSQPAVDEEAGDAGEVEDDGSRALISNIIRLSKGGRKFWCDQGAYSLSNIHESHMPTFSCVVFSV